jgi:hypothetical protein
MQEASQVNGLGIQATAFLYLFLFCLGAMALYEVVPFCANVITIVFVGT